MKSIIFTVALRYFRARNKEKLVSFVSYFSILGISIGVAALIVVMSIMNGFREEFVTQIMGLESPIYIESNNPNGIILNYDEHIKNLQSKIKEIKDAKPVISSVALIVSNSNMEGIAVKGMTKEHLMLKPQIANNIIRGSLLAFYDKEDELSNVLVGTSLAKKLNLTIDSTIKLFSPSTVSSIMGIMPRIKEFKVKGIYYTGIEEYDNHTIIIPFEFAQKFYNLIDATKYIEVLTKDNYDLNEIRQRINHASSYELIAHTWMEKRAEFLKALNVERVAMFSILSLIIIVAAFNILSSLFMLVKDKNQDIAILKSFGVSNGQIMSIFIFIGSIIGIIGTIIGVILGSLTAIHINKVRDFIEFAFGIDVFPSAIYFFSNLPSKLQIENVMFVSIFSVIVAVLSALFPSYKASKLSPMDIIRS